MRALLLAVAVLLAAVSGAACGYGGGQGTPPGPSASY